MRALRHPAIARLLEAWDEPTGDWCLVSEYVIGRALRTNAGSDVRGAFSALCGVMRWAHGRGVCHGRLQPGSIVLVAGPAGVEPRVTGFSITPARPTTADDVAGLGRILSTLTTGQPSAALVAPLVERATGGGSEPPFATVADLQAAFEALKPALGTLP